MASSQDQGQVICCHSVDEWKEHIQKGVESKNLVVVYFTATWCGPCRMIAPVFAEIAKKMPHVMFLKVDVDKLQKVAQEYEIMAIPTFLFLNEGDVLERFTGANQKKLQAKITEYAAMTA